jgi:signal transduction histidine kinase
MLFLLNERAGIIQGMFGVTSEIPTGLMELEENDEISPVGWEISEKELHTSHDSEFSRFVKETRLPFDTNLNVCSRAILGKKLIYVSDVDAENHPDREMARRFGTTTFAAIPVIAKDIVIGVVIVDNNLTGSRISEDDLSFLQLLINQAATAIENSMLYNRIEDVNKEFQEIQERLIQGEKLAALGEMAASIAHELKGPLVSIGGFARRLERKLSPDSSERSYAATIFRESVRLERMLTDTLFFSKKAAITCAPCFIDDVVEESLAIVTNSLEEKNIRIKTRYNKNTPPIRGDFKQLKQVFINLFSNAGEAMKDGGTLRIIISQTHLDGENAVSVTISDTGGGIPLDVLNNIFNPFFTTKDSGTGLGLPISNRIVLNHGGKIIVNNRVGIGAQFKVILPVSPATEH